MAMPRTPDTTGFMPFEPEARQDRASNLTYRFPFVHSLHEVQRCSYYAGTCELSRVYVNEGDLNVSAVNSTRLRKALVGLRIRLLGDSVMLQFYDTLKCALRSPSTQVSYFKVDVIPHERDDLLSILTAAILNVDILVINFGVWYNWNPSSDSVGENIDADYTSKGPASHLHIGREFTKARNGSCEYDRCVDMHKYANERRWAHTLDLATYVSDLIRLREGLLFLNSSRMPYLIWKATAPKHFKTPGGMFSWDLQEDCAALDDTVVGKSRHFVVQKIFGSLLGKTRGHFIYDMDASWAQTATHYNLHLYKDCTHYCGNSMLTILLLQR